MNAQTAPVSSLDRARRVTPRSPRPYLHVVGDSAASPTPARHDAAPARTTTTTANGAAEPDESTQAPGPGPGPGMFDDHCLPHRGELYAHALRLTRHPDDAQDLVQDTFLRAYLAWSRFEPDTNCRAWLFRILTNSFINLYRKRRRHSRFATERPHDARAALHGSDRPTAEHPAAHLVADSLGDEVSAALDSLTQDYRAVIEMADLHGVRYRDIADALGVPIGTVMSRLHRARRKLESQLGDYAAADYGIRRAA